MLSANGSRTMNYRDQHESPDSFWTLPLTANTSATLHRDADPVIVAIRSGDVEVLNGLAESSPHSLMMENKHGWIPLHEAAYCGEAGCLRTLLRAHPSVVDKRTLQEQTALVLAVSRGHLSSVRCLLEAGADPDISNKNKETPLYIACEQERMDMVSVILNFGATVNQRCCQGWTALCVAVSRDNTDICDELLQAGAVVNPPSTCSITPLTVAAQRGWLKMLQHLIEKGADVNMQTCDGVTTLYEASRCGQKEIVSALLSKNADANKPNSSGLLPLHIASLYGYHKVVSLLIPVTSRASLRNSWISPLHLAAEHNRHAVAAVLLKTGADVNATLNYTHYCKYDDRRATALYCAVANDSTKTAKLLLNAGASLTLDPISPLFKALKRGCLSTISLLLENGADVNSVIPVFPTSFPAAVTFCTNNLPLLKHLLDNGCNARACFSCTHGTGPHPASGSDHLTIGVGYGVLNDDGMPNLNCSGSLRKVTQFCEWLSTSAVCDRAGPIMDLLLDHVGNVSLCTRLNELLGSREDWLAIKRKSLSPRPLLHLCRLRIRAQMGKHRLSSLKSLPLPDRLIIYLSNTT